MAYVAHSRPRRFWLALEAWFIRYCMSPVAFVAALLLLPLAGMALFQSPWGGLLALLAPALWPLSWWLLRRRHARRQAALRESLVQAGLAACEASPEEKHFTLMQVTGSLPIPLTRTLSEGLEAHVLVPRPTWVVLARVQGSVLDSGWWRGEEFDLEVSQCTEVYLREITHISVERAKLVLHTSGGQSIDIQAGFHGEPRQAMDYLRRCLREMAESHPANGNGGENSDQDTTTGQGNS